jgi:hypothetical protein
VSDSLPIGEPAAGPWRVVPVDVLLRLLFQAARTPAGRPWIVAVDGRSASGKSTLATLLHDAVPGSAIVHTDDIAWHEPFFSWAPLLAQGVLEPVRRGRRAVRYRPPAWQARGREGAVEVPAELDLVIVEGVGAGQRDVARLLDALVWVQSDFQEAENRGIARDVAQGVNGGLEATVALWHEWMTAEFRFLERERPWERACVVVTGTPTLQHAADEVVLAPGPLPTIAA